MDTQKGNEQEEDEMEPQIEAEKAYRSIITWSSKKALKGENGHSEEQTAEESAEVDQDSRAVEGLIQLEEKKG